MSPFIADQFALVRFVPDVVELAANQVEVIVDTPVEIGKVQFDVFSGAAAQCLVSRYRIVTTASNCYSHSLLKFAWTNNPKSPCSS